MKVIYISHTSEMHGSGKAVLNIMCHMIDRGVDVKIVLPDMKGGLFDRISQSNISYEIINYVSFVWPRLSNLRDCALFPYRILRFFIKRAVCRFRLQKVVIKFNPDIIHTNVGVIHTGYYVAKSLRKLHVWHIREYQDMDFGWKPYPSRSHYLKILSDETNHPIAITKGVYQHHLLQNNKNSKVIYDGVFDRNLVPAINWAKRQYFLFVGLVSSGKGADEVVNCFLSIANKTNDYELWIAGGGDKNFIESLKIQCEIAGYSDKVKFLGFRSDINELMSEATALIVASKFEGFGFITAEAMYNGCLVIGRDSAGTQEQFDNGLIMNKQEIGLRYTDSNELIRVLKKIVAAGVGEYVSMIEKAQITAVELYSSQRNADEIYKMYQNIKLNGE